MAWASQGGHMLPGPWGAGHRPPWQPDAPGPVCGSKAFLSGEEPPGSFPPSFLPLPPSQLQRQGFQGCVSTGYAALSLWHGAWWPGMDIWSASTPTARASVAPGDAVARRRAGTRERPRSAVLAKWQSILGMARLASPLPLRATPEGPALSGLPLPGGVCSGRGREGHEP